MPRITASLHPTCPAAENTDAPNPFQRSLRLRHSFEKSSKKCGSWLAGKPGCSPGATDCQPGSEPPRHTLPAAGVQPLL
ncbi:hypothetical protein AV530_014806 [Patagioenas fasciata monilis]|uniref:Uncharacterized protein n=1 Tax=Patagioenas fasciata monilis TaxID=372326 RepID=A0A1V4L141_PATFA|nr:hypothetical protein AV530_014806 [Patagioenas fasciata monilis]